MKRFTSVEAIIDAQAHRVLDQLPSSGFWGAIVEFVVFGIKQAWACLFGAAMLAMIMLTRYYFPFEETLTRYDFLFLYALAIQLVLLFGKLETFEEAKVIIIFHVVGTAMEIFKTHVGSWTYPEDAFFRLGGVPLFSGFMYAAIGSYLARISRIFDLRYSHYPPMWATIILCIAIYVNFFSHHFFWDIRYLLFGAVLLLYLRCNVHFRVFRFRHKMPLIIGFFLIAIFIWVAENIGTWSRAWLYPGQENGWHMVSFAKLGSWYLLMIISFVLVTLVHKPQAPDNQLVKDKIR